MSSNETNEQPAPAEAESEVSPEGADLQDADEATLEDRESGWQAFGTTAQEADVAAAAAVVDADLAAIAGERDEFRSLAQRIQADFENYKKRVQKQQSELVERAAESLVTQLLPVLDAGELAVVHGATEEAQQLVGLLLDTLGKAGLEPIAPEKGSAFDPNEHDAVMHEPGDGEPAIGELMRTGYRWHGRVLRPAMVKVVG